MQTTVVHCTYRTPSLTLTRISDGADKKNMIFSLLHDGERWGELAVSFQDAGCPMLSVQLSGPQADENFADELLKICLLEMMPDIGRPQAILSIPDEWTALAPKYGFFPAGDGTFQRPAEEEFRREAGISYCGLACCLCDEQPGCTGCQMGGCSMTKSCTILHCCGDKGLKGCGRCSEFPCGERMLANPRMRAFARFAAEMGDDTLMDALQTGAKRGMIYHYPGSLVGDYDLPGNEERILAVLHRLCGYPKD